ncbi:MAG: Spo0B domain-containing protein [Moorellales bacterium]
MTVEAAYLELLRKERHDFLNYLQVLYGLLQMRRVEMAMDYIYRIAGEMERRGTLLRLEAPALILAMLAGEAQAERREVPVRFEVATDLAGLGAKERPLAALVWDLWDRVVAGLEESRGTEAELAVQVEEENGLFRIRWQLSGCRPDKPADGERILEGLEERAREIGAGIKWHSGNDSLVVELTFGPH